MKSIRTRLIASFMGTIILLFFSLSAIGIYYTMASIDENAATSMVLLSNATTKELDSYFSNVEQAVSVEEDYLLSTVDIAEYKSNEEYRNEVYGILQDRMVNAAQIITNIESVYFRPDPEAYGGTSGFFMAAKDTGGFQSVTPTNILKYDKDDREHVAWYYEPIQNGQAMWLEPYSNENINVYMISYVAPVYLGSDFLGVIGMDINMNLVHLVIDKIDYQNSEGALISEGGNLLYHADYNGGLLKEDFTGEIAAESVYFEDSYIDTGKNYEYSVDSKYYRVIVSRLENDMLLAISTPESEMFKMQGRMLVQLGIILVFALVLVIFVSMNLTKKIVSPILELTVASSRIAKGELDQEIVFQSKDEIGSLADSIRKISVELKEYIDYIHDQAYLDAMTGVRNKGAYLAEEKRLERLIRERMASFTIYVFDVNGLKRMNDTKGHEFGDMMIKDAALNIRDVFGRDQLYRIGGDEFVVFGPSQTESEIQRRFARFDEQIRIFNEENVKYEEELAVSKGVAVYDAELDNEFADVFARADEDMYRCKAKYYESHGDRRRRS
ncbi:MAG: diguanylate cyclase [Lachnospiraceae bacterium]|nr:diguanylate cyclase [Lachnospiraceae bacterium]